MKEKFCHLEKIKIFLGKTRIYLVGGFLRDNLLARTKDYLDFDLVVEEDALSLSKDFAKRISGSWFSLDDFNRVYRVVKKGDFLVQYDFSAMRGEDIIADLKSRDYTIDALGYELKDDMSFDQKLLIDPCRGREDLKKGLIRVIDSKNLIDDPLRILRAISLAGDLGFEIEPDTLEIIGEKAGLLKDTAGERITEELFKILRNIYSHKYVKLMNELGIIDIVVPFWAELKNPDPGPYHHLRVDLHSIESLKQLEIFLEDNREDQKLSDYLKEELRAGRSRREVLKLATLLHDIGKGPAYFVDEDNKVRFTGHEKKGSQILDTISQRLKLSRKESLVISDMVYYHLRPGFVVDHLNDSKRVLYRYFRDTKDEAVSVMLLSIADKSATRGRLSDPDDIAHHKKVLTDLIKYYFQKQEEIKPPKLIDGNDIMEILKIGPAPEIGRILKEIEEKQALGEIKTREEAIDYVKKLMS
ncbi:MAG: HD domain-containing protein [Candidatus Omnitrophica bacterium]|nr:HD domain-containing protein [Candidatus Omnitrophota bacterium]